MLGSTLADVRRGFVSIDCWTRELRSDKRNGKIQYLVSWRGYPSKFNAWIDELATKSSTS